MTTRLPAFFTAASIAVALAGCGGSGKDYDISPIFPLSSDKCAKYGGDEEGEGPGATCMVNKDQCEKAAADWRNSTDRVQGAIQFRCD